MSEKEIWVLAESRQGKLTRVSKELLGAARELAADHDLTPLALFLGPEPDLANELAAYLPTVVWANHPELSPYEALHHLHALDQISSARGKPFAILAGASAAGAELLPRLAARWQTGFAGSAVGLRWEQDQLAVRRPVFGGRVYQELAFVSAPAVITMRPGAFGIPDKLPQAGTVESLAVEPPATAPKVTQEQNASLGKQELTEANCVVAGGRGLGQAENFAILEKLASLLNGAVAASRAVVDSGWRPHDDQVGKSGKTVAPELYFACGISGAIHHTLGMNTAKVVVAINTDPDATIFQHADFGLVGDVLEVVPALNESLQTRQN